MADSGICMARNRGLIFKCNLCPISFYRKGKRGSKTEFYSYSLLRKKKVFICFTCVFIKKITYTKTPGDSVLMVTCTS